MIQVLTLPRISMNMEEGTIVAWHRKVGDEFKSGDVLYEVETEKVVSEVEAPCDGRLLRVLVEDDASIAVGDSVCEIEALS